MNKILTKTQHVLSLCYREGCGRWEHHAYGSDVSKDNYLKMRKGLIPCPEWYCALCKRKFIYSLYCFRCYT